MNKSKYIKPEVEQFHLPLGTNILVSVSIEAPLEEFEEGEEL